MERFLRIISAGLIIVFTPLLSPAQFEDLFEDMDDPVFDSIPELPTESVDETPAPLTENTPPPVSPPAITSTDPFIDSDIPEQMIVTDVPEYQFEQKDMPDIQTRMTEAKAAFADKNYERAQNLFESILHENPNHTVAADWLRRIAEQKTKIETAARETTRAQMLENVQSAWNTPRAPGKIPPDLITERAPTDTEIKTAALREKLDAILVPAISFQDADIQQVLLELSALCRKLDPEHKGVNLVAFGTTDVPLPPVTFSGTDLSMLELFNIITQMAGMKYEIFLNIVHFTPLNYESPQQIVSAEFDISPAVGQRMAGAANSGLIDVRGFFSTVPFPPGSSAQYNSEFNILFVRNIPKHMDKIEMLLQHYNRRAREESARQVEIETKFIEVSQGVMDELGFEWTIGAAGDVVNADRWSIPGGQKFFSDTLRTGEAVFNNYPGFAYDSVGARLGGTPGELLIQKMKGTPANLIIRALERSSGSDLLSAPKIVTKSGETATIHVGEIHYYPTAFDVVIERYAQASLVPLDYEEERTGVMLEVTPELDTENGTINLKLAPEIRELAGFNEQHIATLWPFFTGGNNNAFTISSTNLSGGDLQNILGTSQKQADRLFARRPVFKTRKINTAVTIEDGSTIAMGGLIKEELETFKDSVPVIGRIPLIGRLFRSEGERSIKRNLLIFVTANQIDAAGNRRASL